MPRVLRVFALLALLPPALLAAVVVAIHLAPQHWAPLEVLFFGGVSGDLALGVVPLIIVSDDLSRRGRVGRAVNNALFILAFVLWLAPLQSIPVPEGDAPLNAVGGALLPAVLPLLALVYAEYAARHPRLVQPTGG